MQDEEEDRDETLTKDVNGPVSYSRKVRVVPTQTGVATLSCPGFTGPVEYEVSWPKALRRKHSTVKGFIRTSSENALACFRAGSGHLTLENGKEYQLTIVGHTQGTDVAYVELKV